MKTIEIKSKMDEIKNWEQKIKRKDLIYEKKNIYLIFSNMKQ